MTPKETEKEGNPRTQDKQEIAHQHRETESKSKEGNETKEEDLEPSTEAQKEGGTTKGSAHLFSIAIFIFPIILYIQIK